ncbi:TPA: hypothetical protein I8271_003054 [Kluyvera intermedia]|uniref:hypothetical protein n=1 Tax=Enterobacteriaceae TaxID=543 RepID=UPI000B059D2D|nr:hypothetical protein [Phytobacter ursingii]HAT2697680.1 hypothetical protein [Kluyvera intermedia]HAT3500243.1 hypothetical protein [Kluyvera intermedia]HAT3506090.1 hypothetical protein [Kluyvera intermedia]
MAAQAPCPGYDLVTPVSTAPPGNLPDGGVNALSGLRSDSPGKRSAAGNLPDGGVNALSGLRSGSPGKRSAAGESPGWRRKRLVRATIW